MQMNRNAYLGTYRMPDEQPCKPIMEKLIHSRLYLSYIVPSIRLFDEGATNQETETVLTFEQWKISGIPLNPIQAGQISEAPRKSSRCTPMGPAVTGGSIISNFSRGNEQ